MMAASSKLMMEAERRFPVRIRVGVPLEGLGGRLDQMRAWLDGNCGADGWALTPSGVRGVSNDALSIYFLDPTLASAFVARWCAGYKVETAEGVFRVRADEPAPRIGRSEEHTSELQSRSDLVCRLLLEKKKKKKIQSLYTKKKKKKKKKI